MEINLFVMKNDGLYLVVAFHGLDPSLGKKIEWFILFYAIECFSPRQENDTFPTYILKIFSDSFQSHLSSVQYLHCVFIWPYFWPSFIFTFFFFFITVQTAFHEIYCIFLVFENVWNRFLFPRAKFLLEQWLF